MHVQALFARLDSDGDGQLTAADFARADFPTGFALWEELRRDFAPADPHVITPVEFIAKVKAVALAHALSKEGSFEKVPATNLACLHALNASINLVIIELCKNLHSKVAALTASALAAAGPAAQFGKMAVQQPDAAAAAGAADQLVLVPPHALWREHGQSELREAMLYIEEAPKQMILKVYRALDANEDGLITPEDFVDKAKGVASRAALDKWERLRHEFDTDGSNSIDLDEFIDCFKAIALRQPLSFGATFNVEASHKDCLRLLNGAVNQGILGLSPSRTSRHALRLVLIPLAVVSSARMF